MVITGVLARIPQRIKGLIYLDAFVPEDGRALVDYVPPDMTAAWDVNRDKNLPLPPIPLSFFGVTDPAMVAFIEPRLAAQSWRTFYQPVKALKVRPDIPVSYVVCTGYEPSPFAARLAEMEADPAVRITTIDTSHHCMLTALDDTVEVLLNG
jgi:pimeloyl-ACP methyl ester carboxylesterase